jgi:hypothetical protein
VIEDVVWELHQLLDDLGVRHVFGGALALNYYATPRATIDVDVNVAVNFPEADSLVRELEKRGFQPYRDSAQWLPIAGVRLVRDDAAGGLAVVDLFFSFDDYHRVVLDNARPLPMLLSSGDRVDVPVMSADDLVVFKASFNRDKDWVDVRAMVESGAPVDADYVAEHLVALRGPTMYPRVARIRRLLGPKPT